MKIGSRFPDFVNVNGRKLAIEVFSDYFKIKNYGSVDKYKRSRRYEYSRAGYRVLFIRYGDLDNREMLDKKISNFVVKS